jgi:hypothetical protein
MGTSTVGGNLSANSGNGSVTQDGALRVSGTTGIAAGTGRVELKNLGNVFGNTVTASGSNVDIGGVLPQDTAARNAISQIESSNLLSYADTESAGLGLLSPAFNAVPTDGSDTADANEAPPTASSGNDAANVTLNIGGTGPSLRIVNGGVNLPSQIVNSHE